MLEERKAFYRKNDKEQERTFIFKYRGRISEEATTKHLYYKHAGRQEYFKKMITSKGAIARQNEDGTYKLNDIMQ